MSTVASRTLIRVLAAAFLLLLGNGKNGAVRVVAHRDAGTTRGIATANLSAAPSTTSVRKDVETAQALLLASDANLRDSRLQPATAPTRIRESLCSCERTTGQAARPPPFQS